jgi:hypothetical protein
MLFATSGRAALFWFQAMRLTRLTEASRNSVTLIALLIAAGLGLAGRVAVRAGTELPHGYAVGALGHKAIALGAPWLAAAWVIGALARSGARGAAAGATALALGTGGWYTLTVIAAPDGAAAASYALPMALAWGVAALAAGALFGLAGAAWGRGPVARAIGVAALAGALAGESLLLMREWSGRAADAVLAAELAVGLFVLVAARRRVPLPLTLGLFALAALGMAEAEGAVRGTLRLVGWAGP